MITSWIGMALVTFQLYLFSRNDEWSKYAFPVNLMACVAWSITAISHGDMALLLLQFILAVIASKGIVNWFYRS